jgi:hypothetical protein
MRRCLFVVFFIALAAATARPALANITGASISGAPSFTGLCPHTMTFSGTVTGTPGTTFTYAFNRFINGAQQVADQGAHVMPASGQFPVSDSIDVNSSTSGATFDQIWVHGIAGGQMDVYSNKQPFAVNCRVAYPIGIGPGVTSAIETTVALAPSNMLNTYAYREVQMAGGGTLGFDVCTYFVQGGAGSYREDAWAGKEIVVGYEQQQQSSCDFQGDYVYRGAVKFDLSSLAGKTVKKAILTFHIRGSHQPLPVAIPLNCAAGVFIGTTDWTVGPYPESWEVPVGDSVGPVDQIGWNVSPIDVTSRVSSWVHGDVPNDGFTMKGKMENLNATGVDICSTYYNQFKLTVTYI